MTRALVMTASWVLAGGVLTAVAYWGFLNTPESTVWSLALSVLLAILTVALAGATLSATLIGWARNEWSIRVVRYALGHLHALVLPLLLLVLAWWVVLRAEGWIDRRSGEISAWFIAQLGWSDVTMLFRGARWIGAWLRWIAVPFVVLVWLRTILVSGWQPSRALIVQALSPLRLLVATAAFAIFVWGPWRYVVPWRPRALPLSAEMPFIIVKLGVVVLLAALGAALIIRAAARVPAIESPSRT